MLLQLVNDFAVTQLQIRVGAQVVAEINGAELRDVAGIYFSLPRVVGPYNITVFAKDSTGCTEQTTAIRTVSVF